MADISEVMDAVRDAVAAVLYPNGVPPGPAPASVVGKPIRAYVGWPGADLDPDLRAGICHVTIWTRGTSRSVGPYLEGWQSVPPPPASMSALVGDEMVTFGGTAEVPHMIAAVVVDQASYTYPLAATGETPETVAAALAAKIAVDRPASTAGPILLVPNASRLLGRVVAGGVEKREVRRMAEGLVVTAWCPSSTLRDQIMRRLDLAFEDEFRSIPLPDGTAASVTYGGMAFDEEARAQPLHRRDLYLTAEYPTMQERVVPGIAVTVLTIAPDPVAVRRTILS